MFFFMRVAFFFLNAKPYMAQIVLFQIEKKRKLVTKTCNVQRTPQI